jgi:hypothetical protein
LTAFLGFRGSCPDHAFLFLHFIERKAANSVFPSAN